jgi:drug/metabolite transporter (DMT)-like permease
MNPGLVDWGDPRILGGKTMLLLAAICWAGGSILYRRRSWHSTFWAQTFWQLLVSTVVVAVIALPGVVGQRVHWSPALLAILAYNWVVTTAIFGGEVASDVVVSIVLIVTGIILTLRG